MATASRKEDQCAAAGITSSSRRHDEDHPDNVYVNVIYGTAYDLPSFATRRDTAEFILCIDNDAGTASNVWYIPKASAEPKGRPV